MTDGEIAESESVAAPHLPMPWARAIRSANLWALIGMAAGAGYSQSFFQSWLGTYMANGRGFTQTGLLFASLPFLVAAVANMVGGFIGDGLVRAWGLRRGRSTMLAAGMGASAIFLTGGMLLPDKYAALVSLSLGYGGLAFAQPALMGICLDMGGKYGGAITGTMNTAAYSAAFLSSVIYGYLVKEFGYTVPFLPMIVLMAAAAVFGLRVNAEQQVVAEA
jgi:MFS family permease